MNKIEVLVSGAEGEIDVGCLFLRREYAGPVAYRKAWEEVGGND